MKKRQERPESFAGQEQFLLFQKERLSSGKRSGKLLAKILVPIFSALLISVLALGFFCPSWLFGILAAKVYYPLSVRKFFRQSAFSEISENVVYSGTVRLEGKWNGLYSIHLQKDGSLYGITLWSQKGELFCFLADAGEDRGYLQIPLIREEYGTFPLPPCEAEPPSFFEKIFPKCVGSLFSPAKVYYETSPNQNGEEILYLTAVYDREALAFTPEEAGMFGSAGIPLELLAMAEKALSDSECLTVKISSDSAEIRLESNDQTAALLDLQREENGGTLLLPEEVIDLSGGWDPYFEGLFGSGDQALEVFEDLTKEPEDWQEQAQTVNLTMTKIAVKKQKFGLPWDYKNLPDGLPELSGELLLPGDTMEFSFPEQGVKGKLKNYKDQPEISINCDVTELEVKGTKWKMTVNGVGIGTDAGMLESSLGEASYIEQTAGETLYRYWDEEHQILLDFLADKGRITKIRYQITE